MSEPPDIWSEWIDAIRLGDRAGVQEMLADFGVTRDALAAAGWVGQAFIRKTESGYEPTDERDASRLALISPQLHGTTLAGLVAWHPLYEGRVYPRTSGEPGTGLLGDPYPLWERALTVHSSPLAWLQAGAEGVCVVDWTDPGRHLPSVPLVAGDELTAERLRAAGIKLQRRAA